MKLKQSKNKKKEEDDLELNEFRFMYKVTDGKEKILVPFDRFH